MTFRVTLVASSECQSDTLPSPRNSAMWWNAITVGVLVDPEAAHLDWLIGVAELELERELEAAEAEAEWELERALDEGGVVGAFSSKSFSISMALS